MSNLRYTWEPFLKYGQLLEIKKNTNIYHQGEEGKGFYYLSKGEVEITLLSHRGDERIINYVPTGMLFGEHGVNKEPYVTSAKTTAPSILYYFSDEALSKVCKENPIAANIFSNSIIYKLRLLAEIISFMDSPVEQQMAYYLLKLFHENGDVSIDQTSFARYIGTSRITVNKMLQKWKQEGLIELSKRTIHFIDIGKMNSLSRIHEYNQLGLPPNLMN